MLSQNEKSKGQRCSSVAYCVPSMMEVWGFSPTAKKTNRHRGEEICLQSPSTCREARCDADTHIHILVQARLILTPQKVHPKLFDRVMT